MTKRFFDNCKTLDELRKTYKELLQKYHPDNGGDLEICKMVNVEYKKAFDHLKNSRVHFTDAEQEAKEQKKWSEEADERIREMIMKFINFEGMNIEIIGCWIWVDGLTFPFKDALKEAGFKWSRSRQKWHWTSEPATEHRYYKGGKMKFDEIRNKYGSANVETEKQLKLA